MLYQNSMPSPFVLNEYGVNTNNKSLCLDGAKRDRLVWIGYFSQTARTLAYSTNMHNYTAYVLDFMFSWHMAEGPFSGLTPSSRPMNALSQYKDSYVPFDYALNDYQMFGLIIYADYLAFTGDLELMRTHWSSAQTLISTFPQFFDPFSGLVAGETAFYWTVPANGTAPPALVSIALDSMAHVAESLGDSASASNYSQHSSLLKSNIERLL